MVDPSQSAGGIWTFEEFDALPDIEGVRQEVIGGRLYLTRTPPLLHQEVLGSFLMEMLAWACRRHQLGRLIPGPVGVILGAGDFPSPDLVFVQEDRREIITPRAIEGIPDLIVECVAPETAERDRGLKRQRYEHYGVPEYWVIDAESRAVEIYRHDGRGFSPAELIRNRWLWQPMPNGPVLELSLPNLLEGYDEMKSMFEERERQRILD
jgi:Uma2 family endonuclease